MPIHCSPNQCARICGVFFIHPKQCGWESDSDHLPVPRFEPQYAFVGDMTEVKWQATNLRFSSEHMLRCFGHILSSLDTVCIPKSCTLCIPKNSFVSPVCIFFLCV